VGSKELGWPVHGELVAVHRRAGKNEKTGGIHKLGAWPRNIRTHLMFLGFLTWPRNIRTHLMFLGLTDVYKLCTLVFKPRNVFLVMNINPLEHKKAEE
jgi:hypothetical protein